MNDHRTNYARAASGYDVEHEQRVVEALVARSPTAIRKTLDVLGKRLRRRIAAAERDPAFWDFVRRAFHGDDVGGNA